MIVGIPREILPGERRVAATPDTVGKFVKAGYEVIVEGGAGAGIYASDADYEAAGARVTLDVEELYASAHLILKVKQPCFDERLGDNEVVRYRSGMTLVTFLHPAAPAHHEMIKVLAARGVTSFTMDGVPRTSRAQSMDALTSMSTVTGYKAIILAASVLPRFVPLMGTAVGMLKPARILVVGTGVVGLQALATGKRLGAACQCVDTRPRAREDAASLGVPVVGFEVPSAIGEGAGGYACALPDEWLRREQEFLTPLVAKSDIVILSALVPGEEAPILMTKQTFATMQPGSVVVDISIDQGGNCELTRPGAVEQVDGVTIIGTQNVPGSVPVHASQMYAENAFQFVKNLFKEAPGKIDWEDDIVAATLVTRDGTLRHAGALKAMAHH